MSESGAIAERGGRAAGGIDRAGWTAVATGAAAAALVLALPFVSFVLSYFVTLSHEMGHAVVGWLYGYPSIPAFDFTYGGGVTTHGERMVAIPALATGALLWVGWLFRRNPASLALALGACALYAGTAWSGAHHAVVLAMGHGTELAIAGVFLHRALSGNACERPGERPLYAFVGAFVVLHDVRFAWRLCTSPFHRELYGAAKGGGHWMDFSRLAHEHLGVSLETVAAAFLALCALPPLVAVAANHYREAVGEALLRLRRLEAE